MGTLTTGSPISDTTAVFVDTTVMGLSPVVVPSSAFVVFSQTTLSLCDNTGTVPLYLLAESEVTTLSTGVCKSICAEGVEVEGSKAPSTAAKTELLSYGSNGQQLCAAGTLKTGGCECQYSGTTLQEYCLPIQPHSFDKPANCTDASYDLCLDVKESGGGEGGNGGGEGGNGGGEGGNGEGGGGETDPQTPPSSGGSGSTTPTSFGGKSSFGAASGLVVLAAAAAILAS